MEWRLEHAGDGDYSRKIATGFALATTSSDWGPATICYVRRREEPAG
jgi:hypothetical protein